MTVSRGSVLPSKRRLRLGAAPTVAIKRNGRFILNRPAASFFEDAGYENVILMWNPDANLLSIVGIRQAHKDQHKLYFTGGKWIPGAFSGKTALQAIRYDLSENRTFPARLVSEDAAIEVVIPKRYRTAAPVYVIASGGPGASGG